MEERLGRWGMHISSSFSILLLLLLLLVTKYDSFKETNEQTYLKELCRAESSNLEQILSSPPVNLGSEDILRWS